MDFRKNQPILKQIYGVLSVRLRWLHLLGLLIVVLSFLIVVGEWGASLMGWPQPSGALFVYDRLLGYRYPQSKTVNYEIAGERYRVEFDREGVADRLDVGAGLIYVLGDGLISGLELPPDQRLAYRVAKLSGQAVVNLSVLGYGALQQERLLEEKLLHGSRPDSIVLVLNLDSDLIDNVRDWEGSGVPSISLGDEERLVQEPEIRGVIFRLVRNMLMASRLYGKFSAALAIAADNRLPDVRTLALLAEWDHANTQTALLILQEAIARMAALADEYGIRFQLIVWIDPVIKETVPAIVLDSFARTLGTAVPQQRISVFGCDFCRRTTSFYVPGGRHFGSAATQELAVFISQTK